MKILTEDVFHPVMIRIESNQELSFFRTIATYPGMIGKLLDEKFSTDSASIHLEKLNKAFKDAGYRS